MWSWQVEYTYNHDTFGLMSVLLAKEMMSEDIAIAAFHFFGYDYDFDNPHTACGVNRMACLQHAFYGFQYGLMQSWS